MSYTDDAVLSKLSSLNETQESIVTLAQWLMFHRRHADRTANLWMSRLQSSTSTAKRLNLIYLANDVVQQSRARGKNDFLIAFEPIMAEAVSLAYRSASQEIQGKLKRVVQVWRERKIFDPSVQDTVERRIKEIDDSRGGGGINGASGSGRKLGGSLFGGSFANVVPAELEVASKAQGGLSKVEGAVKPAVDKANEEFAKMMNPDTPTPTAPVHAAKLNTLIKHLAAAQGAVEASMTARKSLLDELEKLVESNRARLAEDETTSMDLAARKEGIEAKKREVEDNIMRGLSTPTSPESGVATPDATGDSAALNGASKKRSASKEIERPEAEGFTPPPPDVESFTPPPTHGDGLTDTGDVAPVFDQSELDARVDEQYGLTSTTGAENVQPQPPSFTEPAPAFEPPPALPDLGMDVASSAAAAANEFLNNLNVQQKVGAGMNGSASPTATSDPRLKRRKLSHKGEMDEEMFGLGADGLGGVDEEGVSALLNR